MINTIYGELDESLLNKTEGFVESESESTSFIEYRLKDTDELIHRSVHITLKEPAISTSFVGE